MKWRHFRFRLINWKLWAIIKSSPWVTLASTWIDSLLSRCEGSTLLSEDTPTHSSTQVLLRLLHTMKSFVRFLSNSAVTSSSHITIKQVLINSKLWVTLRMSVQENPHPLKCQQVCTHLWWGPTMGGTFRWSRLSPLGNILATWKSTLMNPGTWLKLLETPS